MSVPVTTAILAITQFFPEIDINKQLKRIKLYNLVEKGIKNIENGKYKMIFIGNIND